MAAKAKSEPRAQSAAAPSPFPPIADYAFLSNCHTGALVAAGRGDRMAVRPELRLAERVREPARPRGRLLPLRSVRDQPPDRTHLRAGDERPRDDLEDAERLDRRPRRADDGAARATRTRSRRTRGLRPTTTPNTCSCARSSASRAASRSSSSASPSSTTGGRPPSGRSSATTVMRPTRREPARRSGCSPTSRWASRATGSGRGTCSSPATAPTARLSWAEELAAPKDVDEAVARIEATTRFWRAWLQRARIPDHRWRDPIQRSALAIKGLTYMPTGATVAALTTSLPETPGGERNWDYRYTWIRDSTFTLQALHWLNLTGRPTSTCSSSPTSRPTEDGSLQIMYGIDGRRDLTESTRDELTGYAGARPVRIGNGAFDQRQNDVFGAALDSILLHSRHSQRLPRRLWPIVQTQAECATKVWREPDQGIWEARGKPQHYVSSKLMCWVALDRAAQLAEIRGDPDLQQQWRATADEIKEDILAHGLTDKGVLRQHYETDSLDASTLLAAILGFLPGDDERLQASVNAIADDLTEDGFVLRYRTEETDDGLSGKEGTFLICSFWLVSALAIIGELQRARDLMDRLLRIASPLGLFAEEFDADTGPSPRQLPAGVLAPGADRGGGADHHPRAAEGALRWTPTTSSSSAPAPAAARSRGTWLPPARRSFSSSAATGSRASRRTGPPTTSSSTTATCPRTPGTTRRARRSSRRSTTSSAGRPSSTGRRSTACARRTSASSSMPAASRRPGRSSTRRSSRTTRRRSSSTRSAARAARTRPSRPRARRTHSRRSRTSRGSSSSRTTSRRPATNRSTPRAGSG